MNSIRSSLGLRTRLINIGTCIYFALIPINVFSSDSSIHENNQNIATHIAKNTPLNNTAPKSTVPLPLNGIEIDSHGPTTKISNKDTINSKARIFVLYNYHHLINNIIIGKGPYIDSLFTLLNIPITEQPGSLASMKMFLVTYKSIPEFTNTLVASLSQY